MNHIDHINCLFISGLGSLIGFVMMELVRTNLASAKYAVQLYKLGFLFCGVFVIGLFVPESSVYTSVHLSFVCASFGLIFFACAFRPLNGLAIRRRYVAMALATAALLLSLGAAHSEHALIAAVYSIALAVLLHSVALQATHMLRAGSNMSSDWSMLALVSAFCLVLLTCIGRVYILEAPIPRDWFMVPPLIAGVVALFFALLPLLLAVIVFATINQRLMVNLKQIAMKDELTGAWSRRSLYEMGEKFCAMSARDQRRVGVLMIDIDHFKQVNDTHGHLVGDEVLKHASTILSDRLRKDALLARYGGEEFCVLVLTETAQNVHILAERLRSAVAAQPCTHKRGTISITVSIGHTTIQNGESIEAALDRADQYLYRAKKRGRNQVTTDIDAQHEPPRQAAM